MKYVTTEDGGFWVCEMPDGDIMVSGREAFLGDSLTLEVGLPMELKFRDGGTWCSAPVVSILDPD